MCLGLTLYASPETYFRRRIPALGKRKRRNLVANWTGLLVSAAVAAAFAQHESTTGRMILWRSGRYLPRGIVVGPLMFLITYLMLLLAYRILGSSEHRLEPEHPQD